MIWQNAYALAILFMILLAVIIGVQLSGVWNCC
jgi:hypothetical protein